VDVLPSTAADVYGVPRQEPVWVKTDHCQYIKYKLRGSWCYDATESVESCQNGCNQQGKKCSALNVIPMKMPNISFWASEDEIRNASQANEFFYEPNAPFYYKKCIKSNFEKAKFLCYGFQPVEPEMPETQTQWTIINNDPEDPVYFSTCYRKDKSYYFEGNPGCPACTGAKVDNSAEWRVGDQCISCDLMKQNILVNSTKIAEWILSSDCERCNEEPNKRRKE